MSKHELNAYILHKYKKEVNKKFAKLELSWKFPYNKDFSRGGNVISIGSFYLDDEDIDYLFQKYKVSELRTKELEQEEIVKKLSEIQEDIKTLRDGEI